MHRVYLHSSRYKNLWVVQYLEEDLRTPVIRRMFHYSDIERVRAILRRANADEAAFKEFESGVRQWGIGATFISLTPSQYAKLKSSNR